MQATTNIPVNSIADYFILNGYSTEQSGLFHGKAGMSLLLFEIAHTLDDERIEAHAFDIFSQAMLTQTQSVALSDGLAGIGYALRYLLNRHYLEGEFEELFDVQTSQITDRLDEADALGPRFESTALAALHFVTPEKRATLSESVCEALNNLRDRLYEQLADAECVSFALMKQIVWLYKLCNWYTPKTKTIHTDLLSERLYALHRAGKLALPLVLYLFLPDKQAHRPALKAYRAIGHSLPFSEQLFLAEARYQSGEGSLAQCYDRPLSLTDMEQLYAGMHFKTALRHGIGLYWWYARRQQGDQDIVRLLYDLFLLPDDCMPFTKKAEDCK